MPARPSMRLALLSAGDLGGCGSQQPATAIPSAATDRTSTEGTSTFTEGAVAFGTGDHWG